MKSRCSVSLALGFLILAGFLAVQSSDGQKAFAQENDTNQHSSELEPESEPKSVHICPMIPIEVYGGASLYEAQYYADDTCSSPTITYAYGSFEYPQTCPGCTAYKDGSESFYGLAIPVPADYDHKMPAGKPRRYSRKALTPDRIAYLYLDEKDVYIKVFSRDVNRADMAKKIEPDSNNFKETIHFAFECSDPSTIGVNVAEIEMIHESKQRPLPDAVEGPTTVYDVTYESADGPAHILTFLCGDPEPPKQSKKTASPKLAEPNNGPQPVLKEIQ